MNLDEIRQILDMVREHELAEFELEQDGVKLRLRKGGVPVAVAAAVAVPLAAPAATPALSATQTAAIAGCGRRRRGAGTRRRHRAHRWDVLPVVIA